MSEALIRGIAISVELVILLSIFYFILNGVRLILFDMGLTQKYSKIVIMLLSVVGCLIVVFLSSHLITFYPPRE
jgi:succinate dehydrogenase/fumarate reductase cytochrome b subunit